MVKTDFLIIGGGIIGLNVALELRKRFSDAKIIIIEKESDVGMHSSGRNSGVIHAGFYYTSNSLKSKLTRQGNLDLTEFCNNYNLPIRKCGKLVTAGSEEDLKTLNVLYKRGTDNNVPLYIISESEAKQIEPRVKTFKKCLWSPSTSIASPVAIINQLRLIAKMKSIVILTDCIFRNFSKSTVFTNNVKISSGYIVNAAGLYADKIALRFGFSKNYRILPFKGIYLKSNQSAENFNTNIYPVPNLGNPFLGVHITLTMNGKSKIGPTAIPAFWREQYNKFDNFQLAECIEVLYREMKLMASSDFSFRKLAIEELKKYNKSYLVTIAQKLAYNINKSEYKNWGSPGIRAQLMNIKTKRLEMDFITEGDGNSFHILNAVSPGWTCAAPFSRYICDIIETKLK